MTKEQGTYICNSSSFRVCVSKYMHMYLSFLALTFKSKREQALQLVYSRRHALKLSTESRISRLHLEREVNVVIQSIFRCLRQVRRGV